jgi:hypothetical protein
VCWLLVVLVVEVVEEERRIKNEQMGYVNMK